MPRSLTEYRVPFTDHDVAEFRSAIARAAHAGDIARHQQRLVSALRLGAISQATAATLRMAIARRIEALRAAV
jgi:hypothetical protein